MNRRSDLHTMLLLLTAGLLLVAVQFALPEGSMRQAILFITLWILPSLLWVRWLAPAANLLERLVGGVGLAFLTSTVLALAATYLPGALASSLLALVAVVSLALPIAAQSFFPVQPSTGAQPPRYVRAELICFGVALLLAALLRLLNVTYKEFQGDEGVIMVRAAQALLGDEMALLRHQKGPVEILLPLLPWGLGGSINELWARAPFIWAGYMVVPSLAALGRRWFGRPIGLLAALLFTIGGFSVAFSRIVQYQSLVMLWTVLSLIFASRYKDRGWTGDLLIGVAFLAAGLLAHYDAVLAAPAFAWLLLARWRQVSPREWLAPAAVGILLGVVLLALFYVPYLFNPTISGTGSYLLQDRLGGTLFSWSVPEVWRMATFYNSTYYVVLLTILALAGMTMALRRRKCEALLFLFAPLIFYTLIVADPRTHIYTIFPGLALLGASGAANLFSNLRQPLLRMGSLALIVCLLGASLIYVYLLFVDVSPERQRTWEDNRPPYFPVTWRQPPEFGLFGFPHQAGWRVAPSLTTEFPYSSNEEPEITAWYMAQAPRTHCPDFRTFIVAANAQDALPYDAELVEQEQLKAVVTVNGAPSLHIYGETQARTIETEATGVSLWRTPRQVAPPVRSGEVSVGVDFDDKIRLLSYTLAPDETSPGGILTLVLYWQALAPIDRNYQVFVHVYDGEMWAQSDGAPDCAFRPTSGWEPGEIIRDPHQLQLRVDAPSGQLPLLVGMYDLLTQERLLTGDSRNDHVRLTDLRLAP